MVVAAAFVGEFLDASRDLLERVWDKYQPINWDYLANGGKDEVDNLRTWYYTYYAFDCNAILTLVIASVVAVLFHVRSLANYLGNYWLVGVVVLLFLVVFFFNAVGLRSEIASLTKKES